MCKSFQHIIAGIILAFSGCKAKQQYVDLSTAGEERPLFQAIDGHYTEFLTKVYTKFSLLEQYGVPTRSNCDDQQRQIRYEIASALDRNIDALKNFQKDALSGKTEVEGAKIYNDVTEIDSGFFAFGKVSDAVDSDGNKSIWKKTQYSWGSAISSFRKYQKTRDLQYLFKTQHEVSNVFFDDYYRAGGYNYELDPNSSRKLIAVYKELVQCIQSDCASNKALQAKTVKSLLNGQVVIAALFKKYLAEPSPESLGKVSSRIKRDLDNLFLFKPNPLVRVESSGKVILPVYANLASATQKRINEIVSSVWKGNSYQLQLEFVNPQPRGVADIILERTVGRSVVSFPANASPTMHIMNSAHIKTIAHESGHLLGFSDAYMTTFSQDDCEYKQYLNLNDLMSSTETGRVLPYHWEKLIAQKAGWVISE